MQIIVETLRRLDIAEPKTFGGLTLFPVIDPDARRPDCATLDEAIAEGWLEVREISDAGSVPQLTVSNRGDRAAFLMDGEELRGAKQNRVLNLSILVAAGETLVVPVSCVEQGRWASRTVLMGSSKNALYAAARRAKLSAVSRNYASRRQPLADQGDLWRRIGSKAAVLDAASPTLAMGDIFERHGRTVDEYERAFAPVDGQCGAIFGLGDRLSGIEVFQHPELLSRMLAKIVRSYALDSIEVPRSDCTPSARAARELIDDLAEARMTTYPAVGLGEDVRIRGNAIHGAALVADDCMVHLCAYRDEAMLETE